MRHDDQDDDGANDRKEKAGRVKEGAIAGLRKDTRNQPADNRTDDADEDRGQKTEMLVAGNKRPGNEADEEADDNVPDNVKHTCDFAAARQSTAFKYDTLERKVNK